MDWAQSGHGHLLIRGPALLRALFTIDLFETGYDNGAAVRAVPAEELDLMGSAVYGPRNTVDKVLKGARMHT